MNAPWNPGAAGAPAPWAQPAAPAAAPAWQAPAQPPAPHTQAPAWQSPAQPPPAPAGWAPPQAPAQAYPPPGSPVGGAPAGWAPPQAPAQPPAQGWAPPQGYPPPAPAYAPQAPAPAGWAPPGMSPFDGVGEAEQFGGPPYFPPNVDAVVHIDEIKAVPSRKKPGVIFICVVCTVAHTNNNVVQIGQQYSQSINMSTYGKADLNVLMTALNGKQPGNQQHRAELNAQGAYTPAKIMEMISPANPFRGKYLALRTSFKPNANPTLAAQGKGFTPHAWSPAQ